MDKNDTNSLHSVTHPMTVTPKVCTHCANIKLISFVFIEIVQIFVCIVCVQAAYTSDKYLGGSGKSQNFQRNFWEFPRIYFVRLCVIQIINFKFRRVAVSQLDHKLSDNTKLFHSDCF